MSDISLADRIDTNELLGNLDYEELFEGTEFEDELLFDDEKSTASVIGGAIGAVVGRRLGEVFAQQIEESARSILERTTDEGQGDEEEVAGEGAGEEETAGEDEDQAEEGERAEEAASEEDGAGTEAEEAEAADEGAEVEEAEEAEAAGEEEAEAEDEAQDESGEEESNGEGVPQSTDELEDMSYRDLQSLAKERDIKANLSRDELTDELAEAIGIKS